MGGKQLPRPHPANCQRASSWHHSPPVAPLLLVGTSPAQQSLLYKTKALGTRVCTPQAVPAPRRPPSGPTTLAGSRKANGRWVDCGEERGALLCLGASCELNQRMPEAPSTLEFT